MHGVFITTKYNHPIPLSRVQWSGVHVVTMLFSSLGASRSGSGSAIASSVATCGRAMHQLRKLSIAYINPLPLLWALGDRDCPLEHVTVLQPPWVCTVLVCVDRTDDAML